MRPLLDGREQLALDGGTPVRSAPMAAWPSFGPAELDAAARVLGSGRVNYWTGDEGRLFEEELAAWVGVRHAVAVTNGTVALELALAALDVGPGDEVVVPAATFIATASAVVACGARPVVADVERGSQCLSARTVRAALGPRTAAVVVVHLAGWPAETAELEDLCRRRGLWLVEDCAQAHGATRDGRMVGRAGHVAAWSFCQDKIFTTAGEGGAVTTDDPEVGRLVWERKDHGKSRAALAAEHPPGFRWLHHSFGTNARMTEIQAAVGRAQLRRVDGWVARRREIAETVRAAVAGQEALRVPAPDATARHAWYRCWLHVRPDRLRPGWDRDRVVAALRAEGAPVAHGGCTEIQRERAFADHAVPETPVAAELGRTSVVLPTHPTLTDAEVGDLTAAVDKVMEAATA